MTLRTKNDFNDVDKLGDEATVEAMHEKARSLNPYKGNREERFRTKGIFVKDEEVTRINKRNNGIL